MSDDWVDAVAVIDIAKAKALTPKWFERVAEPYPNEQINQPTAEAETAVRDLIALCKYAAQSKKPVIHMDSMKNRADTVPFTA